MHFSPAIVIHLALATALAVPAPVLRQDGRHVQQGSANPSTSMNMNMNMEQYYGKRDDGIVVDVMDVQLHNNNNNNEEEEEENDGNIGSAALVDSSDGNPLFFFFFLSAFSSLPSFQVYTYPFFLQE